MTIIKFKLVIIFCFGSVSGVWFLLQVVGVSAVLGTGLDEFFIQLSKAVDEYER